VYYKSNLTEAGLFRGLPGFCQSMIELGKSVESSSPDSKQASKQVKLQSTERCPELSVGLSLVEQAFARLGHPGGAMRSTMQCDASKS